MTPTTAISTEGGPERRSRFRRICVYCGSAKGKKASYQDAAVELGKELVERGIDLVYGGGSIGLMGLVSHAVHAGGGHVIGWVSISISTATPFPPSLAIHFCLADGLPTPLVCLVFFMALGALLPATPCTKMAALGTEMAPLGRLLLAIARWGASHAFGFTEMEAPFRSKGYLSPCLHWASVALWIIPKSLMPREVTGDPVGEVRAVSGMHERKAEMARFADAFIALPGGYGTLEELLEVVTWAQLGIHKKPVGLLNVDGFYDPLLSFIDLAVNEGFITEEARRIVISAPTAKELVVKLEDYVPEYNIGLVWEDLVPEPESGITSS